MGSPDYFLYAKHMSVSLEIPLKDFRGQGPPWQPYDYVIHIALIARSRVANY